VTVDTDCTCIVGFTFEEHSEKNTDFSKISYDHVSVLCSCTYNYVIGFVCAIFAEGRGGVGIGLGVVLW